MKITETCVHSLCSDSDHCAEQGGLWWYGVYRVKGTTRGSILTDVLLQRLYVVKENTGLGHP